MATEIRAILRAILFNALKSDNLSEVRAAIMAMCTDDDIAAVKGHLAELEATMQNEQK